LVDIGLWVRAVHAGSGVVAAGEVTDYTMAAGGSGIPGWIAITAAGLSERCRANPDVEYMLRQGEKLVRVWAPERIASGYEFKMEQVVDTHERLGGIINHLSKR
jgi:hypothetical protein